MLSSNTYETNAGVMVKFPMCTHTWNHSTVDIHWQTIMISKIISRFESCLLNWSLGDLDHDGTTLKCIKLGLIAHKSYCNLCFIFWEHCSNSSGTTYMINKNKKCNKM